MGATPAPVVLDLTALEPTRLTLIPGSDREVALERLHVDPATRASLSLVSFPPGWSRPAVGSYTCAEEFVVLSGALTVSGHTFSTGEWAHLPAHFPRTASHSAEGARALAFFDGPPQWEPGQPPTTPGALSLVHDRPRGLLRPESSTTQGSVGATEVPPGAEPVLRDVLGLTTGRWALVRPGDAVPDGLTGPWLVRRWS